LYLYRSDDRPVACHDNRATVSEGRQKLIWTSEIQRMIVGKAVTGFNVR